MSEFEIVLNHRNLYTIPEDIFNIEYVRSLNLYNNDLESISPNIKNLKYLREIFIGRNNLKSIPIELCSLPNLYYIDLRKNELQEIPIEILKINSLFIDETSYKNLNKKTKMLILTQLNDNLTNLNPTLNKYHENKKDIEIIKKLIINIPSLLINLITIQKDLDYIYELFNNYKNDCNYECKNIIDKLFESRKDKNIFNRILKKYKINIIKKDENYEKEFIEYLKNNIKELIKNTDIIENYKSNNLMNYLIEKYYSNPDKYLKYFV